MKTGLVAGSDVHPSDPDSAPDPELELVVVDPVVNIVDGATVVDCVVTDEAVVVN